MGGAASLYDSETVAAHVEQLDENFSQIAVAVRKQGIDGATLLEDTRKEMLDNLCVSKEIKLRLGSEIDRFRDAHAPVVYGQSCDYGSMPSVSDAVDELESNQRRFLGFNGANLSDEQASKVAVALANNTNLAALSFRQCDVGQRTAFALAKALATHPLQKLNLSYNSRLGDEGAVEIANALKQNASLTELGLRDTGTGDKCAASLAKALKVNSTLESLALGNNLVGDEGAKELAGALRTNLTLRKITLDHNCISNVGARELAAGLQANGAAGGQLAVFEFNDNVGMDAVGEWAIATAIACHPTIITDEYTPEAALARIEALRAADAQQRAAQQQTVKDALDDAAARAQLVLLQRELFTHANALVLDAPPPPQLREATALRTGIAELVGGSARIKFHGALLKRCCRSMARGCGSLRHPSHSSMCTQVTAEVMRLGALTQSRTAHYALAAARWDSLRHIGFGGAKRLAMQPRSAAGRIADVVALVDGSQEVARGDDEQVALALCARMTAVACRSLFEARLTALVDSLNSAASVAELGLPPALAQQAQLDFDQTKRVGGHHVKLSLGPVKGMERAIVKAREYNLEIERGVKPAVAGDGRPLTGVDYVVDWLRATVSTEDPYNLFLLFLLLRDGHDKRNGFVLQRIKNKFFDLEQSPNIRTNVLINLLLLYPSTAEEYAEAPLLELPFDAALAGTEITSCELQLTLEDFLTIKRLMHAYYNVQRSSDASFILKHPVFVDDSLRGTVPKVIRELTSEAEDITTQEALLAEKDAEISALKDEVARARTASFLIAYERRKELFHNRSKV